MKRAIQRHRLALFMFVASLVVTLVLIFAEKFSTDVTCERTQTHIEMKQRIVPPVGDCGEGEEPVLYQPPLYQAPR